MMQMFAAAKADFHAHGVNRDGEQRAQILWGRLGEVDLQLGQQLLEQVPLMAAQRLAVTTAKKVSGTAQRMGFFGHVLSVGLQNAA
jgi:hypothetical protein